MKQISKLLIIISVVIALPSCSEYLDVVPDNTMTLEDLFKLKEEAWDALAKVYSYMPTDDETHNTFWTLGDEWLGRLDLNDDSGNLRPCALCGACSRFQVCNWGTGRARTGPPTCTKASGRPTCSWPTSTTCPT